jgi:hypothetical protein
MMLLEDCLKAGSDGVMIPNETYHALPGLSGSKFKLLEESNRHLDHAKLFDEGNKACFDLGTHVHTLVLEPHLANAVTMPKFANKQIAGLTISQQKEEFLLEHPDKLIISNEDHDKAQLMARNVLAISDKIIKNSICERSLFVEYAPGVILKSRIDAHYGASDFDLKTITLKGGDFSDYAIQRHCKAMNYYRSAAFRRVVLQTLGMSTNGSYLIFVSTTSPHYVKIRQIPESIMDEEVDHVHDLLLARRRYLKNGTDLEIKEILTLNKI